MSRAGERGSWETSSIERARLTDDLTAVPFQQQLHFMQDASRYACCFMAGLLGFERPPSLRLRGSKPLNRRQVFHVDLSCRVVYPRWQFRSQRDATRTFRVAQRGAQAANPCCASKLSGAAAAHLPGSPPIAPVSTMGGTSFRHFEYWPWAALAAKMTHTPVGGAPRWKPNGINVVSLRSFQRM